MGFLKPGPRLEPLDTGHAYRQATWALRVVSVVAAVEGLSIVALVGLLVAVLPLKEIQPMILTTGDKRDQIVQVEPFYKGIRGYDLIVEAQVRKYVTLRETLDLQSEATRWQEVQWLSSDEVWTDFYKLMEKRNPDSPFEKARAEKITRSVHIVASPKIEGGYYQVEWEARDSRFGHQERCQVFLSTMTTDTRPQTVKHEDRFMNPIGFFVSAYSVARKEGEKCRASS